MKHMQHPDDNRVLDALDGTEIGYLVHRGDGLDQLQVLRLCSHIVVFGVCFLGHRQFHDLPQGEVTWAIVIHF